MKTWVLTRYDCLGLVICAGMGLGVLSVSVSPMWTRSQRETALEQEVAHSRQIETAARGAIAHSQSNLNALQTQLATHAFKLEPAIHLNQRLASLNDIASSSGLTILEMQPGAVRRGADSDVVPLSFAGTGSFIHCQDFLHAVHQNFADIGVEDMSLLAAGAGAAEPQFKLQLCWFTLPAEQTTASVAQ